MIKRILFFCATLGLAFLLTAPRAQADYPTRLSQLSISVWPEYDTPTVLVILDGKFADTSNASRQVSVLIPSKAKLHVATYANADGTLAKEQTTQSTDIGDGYTRVTFTVPAANFRLEMLGISIMGWWPCFAAWPFCCSACFLSIFGAMASIWLGFVHCRSRLWPWHWRRWRCRRFFASRSNFWGCFC